MSGQVNLSDLLRLDAGDADTAAERCQLSFLDYFLRILSSTFSLFDALRCSEKLVDLVVMITNKLDTQVTADVCV